MIRWVFFDIGWTLVDETQAHRARWEGIREVLQSCGVDRSTDDLMRLMEDASTALAASPFRGALAALGLSTAQQEMILRHARFSHEHETLYPGALQVLDELARGYCLAVIANQSRGTEQRLQAWGIRDRFSLVFASAELGLSKPDPRIFELALQRAGCSPQETVMVGDRLENDIVPAKRQGWRTIHVRQGLARRQVPREPAEQADRTIETIAQLPNALKALDAAR